VKELRFYRCLHYNATRLAVIAVAALTWWAHPAILLSAPTISYVQSNFATPQTPQTTVNVTFTSAQAAGDLNVIAVGWNDSTAVVSTVTDRSGNTYTRAVGPTAVAGQLSQSIYYAKNIAAAAAGANIVTVTFSVAAQYPDIRILEYSGADPNNPVDVTAVGTGTSKTSTSASTTTTNATDLLFAANMVGTFTSAVGTGFTKRIITNPDGDLAEDRMVTATGSYSASATLNLSGPWVMQMVAFRTPVSGGDTTPPTAPTNLTATVSGSQINLSWTASTDNVGVTGYLVERCQGAGCTTFAQIAAPTTTSYSDTGLGAGNYSYRVRATDAAGNLSPYSNVASGVIPDITPPTAPSNLTAAVAGSQINLSWTASIDNVGVAAYLVERCQGVGCTTFAQIATPVTNSYSDPGLVIGSYSYRVRATDAAGNLSGYSNTASGAITDTQPPTAPTGLTATVTGTQINLSWTASTDNVGVTGYRVERCQGAGCTSYAQIATPTTTTYSDSGLGAGNYNYRVRATDAAGNLSAYSNVANGVIPDTTAPTAPTNLTAALSGTQINLSWTASTDNVGVTSYMVERCQGAGCTNFAQIATPAGTTYSDTGLAIASYSYRVRATDAAGNLSGYSNVATASITDTTPPTAPSGLTATVSGTQINLSWTASTDNVGVTGYMVERCQGTGCSTFAQIAAPATTTYSDAGLGAGNYSYRVRATDAAGNLSGYSNVASGVIPDTQPPTAPTNLTAAASVTQINLSWTASTDNVGVTGYMVERCVGVGCATFAQIATPSGTTYNDTGLTAGTSYSYRVRATDAANNLSPYSNIVTALTPTSNPVVTENQQPGSSAWQIGAFYGRNVGTDAIGQIKGYGSATSVNKGQNITFYVSVNTAQTYTIDVYRIGWYQGLGGRLMQHVGPLNGVTQSSCPANTTTGMIQCNWSPGYTLTTQTSWTSGIYLAVLQNANNFYNYIVFTVRDDSRVAALLYQQAVNTDQAYNEWGGTSLYGNSGTPGFTGPRAYKVSFDRPYENDGSGNFLVLGEIDLVRYLERSGYDVAYSTTVDTHTNGSLLLNYRGVILAGHNEYWSRPMYDAAVAARDAGVNLAVMGANPIFWQIRYEPSGSGVANRVVVCYKDATLDPTTDPTLTTVNWRDPILNRPEQTLVGVQYTSSPNNSNNTYVVTNSANWVYAGTGFKDGDTVAGIVGYEADRLFSEYPQPNSQSGTYTLLSHSPYTIQGGTADYANSSVYQAPSGAWVFATGSIYWSWALDDFYPGDTLQYVDARIQQTLANVLNRFVGPGDITPPTAPSGLSATANGSQINLSWTASSDPDSPTITYRVERCQGAGCTNFAQIATSTTTTYSDIGLVPGSYSYQVRASDPSQNLSPYSNVASAAILDTTAPTAPSGLAASVSGSQINLSWTASMDNVGVTGYLVERCQGAGCTTFVQIATSTTTTYSDAGLAIASYSYRVRATDAAGNLSGYSNIASGTITDNQPPTAPTNLTATVSGAQINLSWTASTDNVGVTGYRVERCQGAGCTTFVQIANATTTTYSDLSLTPGNYNYRVRATDAAGNLSAYSNVANGVILDTTPPTAPTNLTATAGGVSQINLTWTASTDNVGVTGYMVERCQGAGCTTFAQIATPASTTFNDTGLTTGTSYSYRVRATDAANNLSSYSNIATASTTTLPTPTAPTNLGTSAGPGPVVSAVQSYLNTSALTSHTTAAFDSTGGDLIVICASSHAGVTFTPSDNLANTWTSVSGPTSTTTGVDLRTQLWYAWNPIVGPNHTVTMGLSAPQSLVISIIVVKGSNISSPIDAVSLMGSDNGTQTVNVVSPTLTTTGTNDLLIGFVKVSVGAVFTSGAGFTQQPAASTSFLDAETGVFAAPGTHSATFTMSQANTWQSAVVAVANNPEQVTLTWTASTETGGTISQYLVERCQGVACTSFNQIGTTVGTAFNDIGLTPSTSYSYRVRAQDTSNTMGPYSSVITFATPAPMPSAPGNLTATLSGTQASLAWAASAEIGGTVSNYLVERCQGAGCANFAQIGTSAVTTYNDIGLPAGNYTYRVRATDSAGSLSPYSNVAGGPVADTQPPTAPSNLTASAASTSQINLSWTASTDNVGVTGYLVERCQGAGCTTFTQIATPTSTTFNDTGLASGTSYSYRVRATDAANNLSAYSNVASATTLVASGTITYVQSNFLTPQTPQTTVNVTFTGAQTAGNLIVVGVGWNDSTAAVSTVTDRSGNTYTRAVGPTAVAGQLSQSIYYAKNIAAAAAGANIVTVTFSVAAQYPDIRILEYSGADPNNPVDVTAVGTGTSTTSTSAPATTTNATDLLFAANMVGTFTITPGTGFTSRIITNPDGDMAEDRMVTATGSYSASATLNLSGPWVMQMVAFRTSSGGGDTTPPTAPTNLTATAASSTQVNLSWTASTDNVGVTGYRVERCQGAGCTTFAQVATPTATSYNDTGLTSNTSYSYRVRATDAAGNLSSYSIVASVTTPNPDTQPPTTPTGLSAAAVSSSQINLSWTASTDNVGVTGYPIERCQGAGCTTFAALTTVTSTTYNDTGLSANASYTYRVRATDAAGNLSNYSNLATATTPAISLTVSPRITALTFTRTQQFTVNNGGVIWSVDGVAGGSASTGTISSTGLYTPPSSAGTHTVTAATSDQSQSGSATVDITNYPGTFTFHNDNLRTGQNTNETVLTPANVNQAQFGKLFSSPVDGLSFASPLYVANLNIPGNGFHNVVYVATEHDSVYAFDADGLSSTPLWHVSFLVNGATTVPCADTGECGDIPNEIGITATPVIDPSSGTMYVVAKTKEGTNYVQRLHALDITTGAEKFGGPVLIQASVPGVGDGSSGGNVPFDALHENQRPGLLLSNGVVYIGFGSHGDVSPYHGWILGYNATSLQRVSIYNSTPDASDGGIWQAGGGLAADASGNLFFAIGNGTFDANTGGRDYGDSVLKISTAGSVLDYFTPHDQANMASTNIELGSAGPVLLLDQTTGPFPHLLITAAKNGTIYVINRDNMGHYNASNDSQIVQSLVNALLNSDAEHGNYSAPVFFNGYVYFAAVSDHLKAFQMINGLLSTAPTSQSSVIYPWRGGSFAISANGTSNGVLWAMQDNSFNSPDNGVLRAYDAGNLGNELYNTSQAGTRDALDTANKFSVPLVANGKIYVVSQTQFIGYGLLP